jgi:hypothetical protein
MIEKNVRERLEPYTMPVSVNTAIWRNDGFYFFTYYPDFQGEEAFIEEPLAFPRNMNY